jgi:hypothetical protein
VCSTVYPQINSEPIIYTITKERSRSKTKWYSVEALNFDSERQKDSSDLTLFILIVVTLMNSVAEPHHFYAAPAPGKNFDSAPASAHTLLYSKAKFLK